MSENSPEILVPQSINVAKRRFLNSLKRFIPFAPSAEGNQHPQEEVSRPKAYSESTSLTRRDVLKKLALIAGASAVANPTDNLPTWGILDRSFTHPWEEKEEKAQYSKEQLFVESNSRIEEGLGNNKVAYVVTHAGYTEYSMAVTKQFMQEESKEWKHPLIHLRKRSLPKLYRP